MHATRRQASHRQAPHRKSAGRRRPWLAAAGYGALGLVCVGVASAAFLLVAPPLDGVRDRLAAEAKARTGRTLTVAGPMSVTLLPRVVVSLHDVAVQPPEGMAGAPTLTAPTIDVETSLWSLLSRRPRLERVTLRQPTIELAVDAQGRRSWDAAGAPRHAGQPLVAPSLPSPEERKLAERLESAASSMDPVASITIDATHPRQARPWAVRLVDGTVRYRDERAGTAYEIDALNVDVVAEDAGAVTVEGAFVWQGEAFHISAMTFSLPFADGQPGVSLKLAGAPLELAYVGKLA